MNRSISPLLVILAATSAFAAHHKHYAHNALKSKTKAHVAAKPALADPALRPLVGTWFVNEDGRENRAFHLSLKANGTFVFAGTGWKSKGRYSVQNGSLALAWTEVDGQPVAAGSMHKLIALNAEMNSFTIDKYNYAKHIDAVAAN